MMPKTIKLSYPPGFVVLNGHGLEFLPSVLHTRSSASTVVQSVIKDGTLTQAIIKSEYDAINDIYLELELNGDLGNVKSVWFAESAQ